MEQDLELPPDMAPAAGAAGEAAEFAAPTAGVPAAQRWIQAGVLAADHVAACAFDSAMRLLNRRACLARVRLSLSFMGVAVMITSAAHQGIGRRECCADENAGRFTSTARSRVMWRGKHLS